MTSGISFLKLVVFITIGTISGVLLKRILAPRLGQSLVPSTHIIAPAVSDSRKSNERRKNTAPDNKNRQHADLLLANERWVELDSFLSSWGASDPIAALEWANSLEMPYRREGLAEVMLGWFETDPKNALAYAKDHNRDFLEDKRLYKQLAGDGNFEIGLKALKASRYAAFSAQTFFSEWAAKDLPAARAYLERSDIKKGGGWLLAVSGVASSWATNDLGAALQWVSANTNGNGERLVTRDAVTSFLKAGDRNAVEEMVDLIPRGAQQDGVISALANQYASNDPASAAAWLQQISDPNFRVADGLVLMKIAETRPDLAALLIEGTPSEEARNARLKNLLLRWAIKDPTGALNYANSSSGLSESTKQQIVQSIAPTK